MKGLEIVEDRPGRCVATWGNLVLVFGGLSLTEDEVDQLDATLRECLRHHPHGVGVLRWVPAGSPGPDDAVRGRVIELFTEFGERLLGFATVLEGSGFWASGARSVLTDIARRGDFSAPLVVLDDADEGARWLAARLGPDLSLTDLRMAVARIKTRIAEQGPPRSG